MKIPCSAVLVHSLSEGLEITDKRMEVHICWDAGFTMCAKWSWREEWVTFH